MESSKSFQATLGRLFDAVNARNDSEFARAIGITPQSVAGAKKKGKIPPAWIVDVSLKYSVSADWLITGLSAAMQNGENSTSNLRQKQRNEDATTERCKRLEEEIAREREEVRQLTAENRKLWKENGDLREKVARLETESRLRGEAAEADAPYEADRRSA